MNSRRDWFRASMASSMALAWAFDAGSAEDDAIKLRRFDDIEPEKYPWGWIRWLINGAIDPKAEMTMGLVHFEPNQTNPLHIHPNSAEFLHVLSGVSEHRIDGKWVTLRKGDTLRIPKKVPHQARTNAEGFEAIIVYDTPHRIMEPVKAEEARGK